jgi:hypothetical protein
VLDTEELAVVVVVDVGGAVFVGASLNETGALREAANEAKGVDNNV